MTIDTPTPDEVPDSAPDFEDAPYEDEVPDPDPPPGDDDPQPGRIETDDTATEL